jgi:hypothetical protein
VFLGCAFLYSLVQDTVGRIGWEELSVKGENKMIRLVRDLEKSIEQAIASSPQVEECMARVRAEGYDASLVLQATLAFAPRGQLNQGEVEQLGGIHNEQTGVGFTMSPHDKKFLRSLKIAVDENGGEF